MSIAELPIALNPRKIAAFCLERGIRRLSLFGSVVRPDFDPARSDIDFLVEYTPGSHPGWNIFTHQDDLQSLTGRPVHLNTEAMLSRHFRSQVFTEAVTLYEHA
jgi:uncharacterized protein